MTTEHPATPENADMQSLKTLTTVVYGLQAVGLLGLFVPFLVGVVINYVKLDNVRGSWLESHFRWQIRTFWFGLLWSILGAITWIILIGMVILFVNAVWIIYRIVKGWLNLNDGLPMYGAA